MGATIEGLDGGKANVSDDRLHIVNESAFERAVREGNAYAWSWSYDAAALNTALAVKNDSTTKTLVIEKVVISSDAAGEWQLHSCNVCTTGTGITGTNLNRSSNNVAPASAYENETGNTLASGKLFIEFAVEADKTVVFDNLGIRLGYGQSIGLDTIAASSTLTDGAIIGYFE